MLRSNIESDALRTGHSPRLLRSMRQLLLGALTLTLSTSLGACSQLPDPEENIESLTAVAEAPAPPSAAEKYDIELHPEPIADPIECSPYLVITARGTGEPNRGQLLSPVARMIRKQLADQVKTINLRYPASTDVNEGGTYAVRLLLDTLNVQAETCPRQRFVLLGYSQGALITGDALSEPSLRLVGGTTGTLSNEAAARIVAVVLYGNPRFSGAESYNFGSFKKTVGGILPRPPGALQPFAERIRDFCVAKDFICQNSLNLDEAGHTAYFTNGMQQKGASFALDLMREAVTEQSAQQREDDDEDDQDDEEDEDHDGEDEDHDGENNDQNDDQNDDQQDDATRQ